MKTITSALMGTALLTAIPVAQAQPTAHYVPGIEGIKAASLPPPGLYLRDYNVAYFANQANDTRGNEIGAVDADVFIYANVPRLVWITKAEILGGNLGFDALIPLQYTSVELNTPIGDFNDEDFGFGDAFAEATWSRHGKQYDCAFGYGIWAPTGNSSLNPTRPGLGYWGHMLTAGLTFYPDAKKQWAISALNRYEINHEDLDTELTPGNAYTLEWGISRALAPTVEAGVVGYYQQQTTTDSGSGAIHDRDQVAAIGPEISVFCPEMKLFTSLRYLYEFTASDRLQGHTVALTLTKVF